MKDKIISQKEPEDKRELAFGGGAGGEIEIFCQRDGSVEKFLMNHCRPD